MRRQFVTFQVACFLTVVLGFGSSADAQIFVNRAATGANDGTSWADAFTDLQSALQPPPPAFSEVWVAKGSYLPGTSVSDSFVLPDNVSILGGFDGTETLPTQRNPSLHITTLSGELGMPGVADNVNVIVTASTVDFDCVLDGFRIVGAAQHGISVNFASPRLLNLSVTDCGQEIDPGLGIYGGGIIIEVATATPVRLTDCEFSRNSASAGGGVYMDNGAVAEFLRCSFNGNAARYSF